VRGQRHATAAPYPRERPGTHCAGGCVYVSCTAHSTYITMDLTQHAATPLHVYNNVFLPNTFNNCNFSQAQVRAP